MKKTYRILLMLPFILFLNSIKAQITIDSFFKVFKHFVAVDYSNGNLKAIEKWSDSTYDIKNDKQHTKHRFFKGNLRSIDNVNIKFEVLVSSLLLTSDKKCVGTVSVYATEGNIDMMKYRVGFDSISIKYDSLSKIEKVFLYFYKFSNPTNQVLERIDTTITDLLKHEYFDFYFNDIDIKTSRWQNEFKTFMQPYSDVLIKLVKKGNIKALFELINLKNKGFSWALSEGLWYYNSLKPCLSKTQIKTVEKYNGKKGVILFRSKEELGKIYKF